VTQSGIYRLRRATEYDTTLVMTALLKMLDKSPAPQMKLAVPEVAYRALKNAAADGWLYVYGDFAILVDVGRPWHSDKRVLIEEIIVRFRRAHHNTVESAVAQLEILARQFGCVAVAAGDTQIGYMAPRYTAAGFITLGTQFYKEIGA
jgi:hypothetical protein